MGKSKKLIVAVIVIAVIIGLSLLCSLLGKCIGKRFGDDSGSSSGTEDSTPSNGVWEQTGSVRYSLVSDEDCPNGNVVDSKADTGITLKTNAVYYFVADFTIKAKTNNSGDDILFTSVKISDDSALGVTEQELSSGKVETSVNSGGAKTFKISYGIPDKAKTKKNVRMVFKLVPKAVADVDLEITFKSNGTEVEELPIIEKKLAVGYTSGLEMVKSGGAYQVKGIGKSTSKEVIIPEVYDNLQVTEIASDAFSRGTITSITIPKTVTKIGGTAFYACKALTEINYNAETIESFTANNNVFRDAGSEGSGVVLNIGKTVKKLPQNFMYSSPNIYRINFDPDCGVTKLEDNTFRSCSALTDVMLPKGLVTLGSYCFFDCKALKNIVLPDSVAVINSSAFQNCSALEKINIPDEVTELGNSSFNSCASLKSLTIPQKMKTINTYAFYGCKGLTEINFNAKICDDFSNSNSVFSDCGTDGLGIKVTIGKNVSKLPVNLFSSAPKITEVSFEEGSTISAISNSAFNNCTSLKKITLPDSVSSIGSYTFNKTALTEVELPANVKTIDSSAFAGCTSLESVKLPENLTTLGYSAFSDCTLLESIVIPEKVNSIGGYLLSNCKGLKKVTFNATDCLDFSSSNYVFYNVSTDVGGFDLIIGKNVKRIPANFCYSTDKVKTVTFAEGSVLNEIGAYSFQGNKLITELDLPQVTAIGNYAFRECASLESIELPSSVNSVGIGVFLDCASLTEAKVNFSGKLGADIFQRCTALKSVTISAGITVIGDTAFYGCSALRSIDFAGTSAQWGAITKGRNWRDNSALTSVVCKGDNATVEIQ